MEHFKFTIQTVASFKARNIFVGHLQGETTSCSRPWETLLLLLLPKELQTAQPPAAAQPVSQSPGLGFRGNLWSDEEKNKKLLFMSLGSTPETGPISASIRAVRNPSHNSPTYRWAKPTGLRTSRMVPGCWPCNGTPLLEYYWFGSVCLTGCVFHSVPPTAAQQGQTLQVPQL